MIYCIGFSKELAFPTIIELQISNSNELCMRMLQYSNCPVECCGIKCWRKDKTANLHDKIYFSRDIKGGSHSTDIAHDLAYKSERTPICLPIPPRMKTMLKYQVRYWSPARRWHRVRRLRLFLERDRLPEGCEEGDVCSC